MIEGDASLNGEQMETGAAAQIADEPSITITAAEATELILVDVVLD